ncbi:MFS monocarboxylate transporter [Aspergillus nomiae NRRL 13137]|uniref:MFS monocarboxylate transporter n=1 Tax=Aspergillus nomiae NRRL (strain ATCC 15546 / NRRL 13137 / CBS 260.88 / M93) TaxID=1509407 RepID=A0A0L1IXT9_ASPN3|nr:MFS monocarboxylate transporter [Aspergillus nomiae NRRL 13137]KNG83963.1 MFS monocarboxylate transporter [Aspergillus nomiae NRRL 13137]
MGTDADIEAKVIVDPGASNNLHNGNEQRSDLSDSSSGEKAEEEPTFDTGLNTWLQVLGSFFLFFNSWGVINTWGAFQTYYEQSFLSDMSSDSIAWIGSLQSFLLMLFGVVTGPLFDAGYFRGLITFGSVGLPFGLMMTSLSSKFWHLILAQGVVIGLSAGCLFVPSVAILPQYFQKKRGLANGLAASGSSIGGVIYPIMFNQLQERVGFEWATRALGFLCFGTCCISCCLMRMRFQPKEKRKLFQLSAYKEPQFVMFSIAMFMGFLGFYNFLFYVQSYAIQTGIVDSNLGFYLLSMLNAGSTFGRVLPNFVADHTGPLNVLTPAATATAILAFAWIGVHNVPGIIVLAVLYGLTSGGFVSLPPVVMASMTKDIRTLGTRLGMVFSTTSFGLLIGTPIGGAILDSTHKYLGVQLFTACCLITASSIFAALRLSRTGFHLTAKA